MWVCHVLILFKTWRWEYKIICFVFFSLGHTQVLIANSKKISWEKLKKKMKKMEKKTKKQKNLLVLDSIRKQPMLWRGEWRYVDEGLCVFVFHVGQILILELMESTHKSNLIITLLFRWNFCTIASCDFIVVLDL